MSKDVSEEDIMRAMETCAEEPVHIPGLVQPFGCLIAFDAEHMRICYASENCEDIMGLRVEDILGQEVRAVLGRTLVHDLKNVMPNPAYETSLMHIGQHEWKRGHLDVCAFRSGDYHVMQFERSRGPELGADDALTSLSFLISQIQSCDTYESLFDLSTRVLRHFTGYDRVMVYKFDPQFNGSVVAEKHSRGMEPFLGLRFPHWDIPSQARAIMGKIPLRFIQDVNQDPIALRAAHADLPPLDITFAACRGVSPVHLEYLRNMACEATMTLSVVVEGALWGMISFHNRKPRVPSEKLRRILVAFLEIFTTKLTAFQKQKRMDMISRVDQVMDDVLGQIDNDTKMEDAMPRIGPLAQEVLQACGLALLQGSRTFGYGQWPDQAVLDRVLQKVQADPSQTLVIDNLAEMFPDLSPALNGCAGVIASAAKRNRAFCIFRPESARQISWAGNPEKEITSVAGKARLSPRGSFSTYLEDIQGYCEAWTDEDVYFAERIWVLLDSAERQALKNTLNRQQNLMIDELNHRVRNILALVRSVSRQARRHYGSLESYSLSLESRIQALAAAHDIASGSSSVAIDIKELVTLEMAPFAKTGRVDISGDSRFIRADVAPIFSLVVHELATNASKYGALSRPAGDVSIVLSAGNQGVSMHWRERGGPKVTEPDMRGFGSTLIEKAVPHELGGTTELRFEPDGVVADIFLPDAIFDYEFHRSKAIAQQSQGFAKVTEIDKLNFKEMDGYVLVVEDNYVIANDTKDQINAFGFEDVEVVSNVSDALEALETEAPVLAVLDINLGPNSNSEPVAFRLLELGVPFFFVTGYGEKANLPNALQKAPRLTKPVSSIELKAEIHRSLQKG